MKKEIFFEKDLFALRLRIILLFIFAGLLNLLLTTLLCENNNSVNLKLILIISTLFTLILLIFLTHKLELIENNLILKNIYGLQIEKMNLNENYSRKIIRKGNNQKGAILWNIFGKKYSSIINIRFKSENKQKKINLNGQILTQEALNKLISVTKK